MSLINNFIKADSFDRQIKKIRQKLKPAMDEASNESKSCKQCGFCCWTRPGCLLPPDIKLIADFLKISPRKLFSTYLVVDEIQGIMCVVPVRHSQKDLAGKFVPCHRSYDIDSPCVFYENDKCIIHSVKPTQCSTAFCWIPRDEEVLAFQAEKAIELGWSGDRYESEYESECEYDD